MTKPFVHPYLPNSDPTVQEQMLRDIGVGSIEELYDDIPRELRFKRRMKLPAPFVTEQELRNHVEGIVAKNISCAEQVSFLGGGCARHYVPAICDEINHRAEFLTAYAGEPYEDHGRFQALFEYESLMAELLDLDVVNVPTFDGAQAASTAIRMAGRITDRKVILLSEYASPERLAVIRNYCQPVMKPVTVMHDRRTGSLDVKDLERKLGPDVAGVYIESPSYIGILEPAGEEIARIVHRHGGLMIVGVDPSSLGILEPPSHYGADITCGDIQPLGLHMNYGGALGGFIGTRDEERFVREYPSRLFGIARTSAEGEYGFGDVLYDARTSFGNREGGKEFVGTASALWGITAAVYLSLMGPQGMAELGKNILQRSRYAIRRLSSLRGVKTPRFRGAHFKEFVVDFTETGKTVGRINAGLLKRGIFGGRDLSKDYPELGQSALYCVTETHSQVSIDALVDALKEMLAPSRAR